jgi:hypothetical protein
MPPAFDIDIKHWPTLDSFVAYLDTIPRPSWCFGITNHNTYIPNEQQWRGLVSMTSMKQTYIGKGWSAGPHLFLAAEAPNPADRGIFQMTPLPHVGVHAGPCNNNHLGIENVGDFDARPPSPAQYQLAVAVNRAILHAWMMVPNAVNVHRECMSGRTCPGRHFDANKFRADLTQPTPPAPPMLGRYAFHVPQAAFTSRNPGAQLAAGPTNGATVFNAGDVVEIGDITEGWGWIRSGIGFVPMAVLDKRS